MKTGHLLISLYVLAAHSDVASWS